MCFLRFLDDTCSLVQNAESLEFKMSQFSLTYSTDIRVSLLLNLSVSIRSRIVNRNTNPE